MFRSRNINQSAGASYALALLAAIVVIMSSNVFAFSLLLFVIREDRANAALVGLVLGTVLWCGGAYAIGITSGVLRIGTRQTKLRSPIAFGSAILFLMFGMALVTWPQLLSEELESDYDVSTHPVVVGFLGLNSVAAAVFGIWCLASVARVRRLLRYFTLALCACLTVLSVLLLLNPALDATGLLPANTFTTSEVLTLGLSGIASGAAGVFGLYTAGRRPRGDHAETPERAEEGR